MLHEAGVQWLHLGSGQTRMDDCPFCRTPLPEVNSQSLAMIQKRVDAGDPIAIEYLENAYHLGRHGLERDVARAVELYERATELGVKHAHFALSCLYDEGTYVEKDNAKAIQHYEAAAMCGQVIARHNLGFKEYQAENYDIALQHWIIAAKLGFQRSLTNIKTLFIDGLATKADYAGALRGHQSAVEEMRSPDREEALSLGHDGGGD